MTTQKSNEQIAEHLCCMAYQLYKEPPTAILKDDQPFAMYSYERVVCNVLEGMILNLLERGFTQEQVVETLQSKQVRWLLDRQENELMEAGYDLATELEIEE